MKKILLILMVMVAAGVNAANVAIVVEDNTSRATIGVDTLIGDYIANTLGHTVHYRDVDTVRDVAFWNAAGYSKVIVVGSEDALPSPQTAVDTLARSNIPFMVIGNAFWDEVNLGTGAVTLAEGSGYIINIGQSHWITRTVQDTVWYWTVQANGNYVISIPDTLHEIDVLLVDKDAKSDTSSAIMAACDVGDTIINTGDGVNISNQRRVFFGSWQFQSNATDSCQFYTLFGRAVSWLDADTLNSGLLSGFCFSGQQEIVGSYVVENSSGTDSIEIYGGYNNMYAGLDWDEKKFFIKPSPLAVQRKLGSIYRSATLGSMRLSLVLKAKVFDNNAWEGGIPPATYSSSIGFAPIIRYWRGQSSAIGYFDSTFAYGCWTYRYGDIVNGVFTPYAWDAGGASTAGTDHSATYIDTLVITEASALGTRYYVDLDTVETESRLLDSALFQGWVANTLTATYTGPGVENGFYSVVNSLGTRPVITGQLSTFSTSIPTPTIATDVDSVVFTGIVGQTIAPKYVYATNSAGGALECLSITEDGLWLLSFESGTDMPITIQLSLTGTQTAGYTFATLTIACADASNTPKTVKVVRNLTAAGSRTAGGTVIRR